MSTTRISDLYADLFSTPDAWVLELIEPRANGARMQKKLFSHVDKSSFSRRQFLQGLFLAGTSRVALVSVGGLPLTLFSSPAHAQWLQALQIAATVASIIAGNNQSDGGTGGLLSANYELLKVALQQLAVIQTTLEEVLKNLNALPGEVDRIVRQGNTRRLQTELLAVVRGYSERVDTKPSEVSFKEWRADPHTQTAISNLLFRLEKARQELRTDGLIDPSSALVVSTVALVESSLLNVLNYKPESIARTLQVVYLPWLDEITNPNLASSAAFYRDEAAKRLNNFNEQAAKNDLGKSLGMKTSQVLAACVGVNDYKAGWNEQLYTEDCGGGSRPRAVLIEETESKSFSEFENRTRSESEKLLSAMGVDTSLLDQPERLVSTNAGANKGFEIQRSCRTGERWHPNRVGVKDRLAFDVSLVESELIVEGKPSGLKLLQITALADRRAIAGSETVPAENLCAIDTSDIENPELRLKQMDAMPVRASAQKAFSELLVLIDSINTERSRYALGFSSVVAAEVAKQNIRTIIRSYGLQP